MSIEEIRKAEKKADKIIQDTKQKAQENIRKTQKDSGNLTTQAIETAHKEIEALKVSSKKTVEKERKKSKAGVETSLAEIETMKKKNQKAAINLVVNSITSVEKK